MTGGACVAGEWVCVAGGWGRACGLGRQASLAWRYASPESLHIPRTFGKWTVRILLECWLVILSIRKHLIWDLFNILWVFNEKQDKILRYLLHIMNRNFMFQKP